MSIPQGISNFLGCVPECNGPENYSIWAKKLRSTFRSLEFDYKVHLDQTEVPKAGKFKAFQKDEKGNTKTDSDGKPIMILYTKEEETEWRKHDATLLTIIELKLGGDARMYVDENPNATAGDTWRALESVYAHKGVANDVHVLGLLHSTKADEDADMEVHIRTLVGLRGQLSDLKDAVPDVAFAAIPSIRCRHRGTTWSRPSIRRTGNN
jgi:hypothetical protein